jgi:hypothetical protein
MIPCPGLSALSEVGKGESIFSGAGIVRNKEKRKKQKIKAKDKSKR